jgi:hypothetical protein
MRPSTLLLLFLAACKSPPQAPAALDDLCSWLFAHALDEDPAAMDAGAAQLSAWMAAHWEETDGGYAISALDQATLDALDGVERHAAELAGIAVITESAHTVDEVAAAVLTVDLTEIYPAMVTYERTFHGDHDAFLTGDLALLETEEWIHQEIDSLIDITADSHSWNQYLFAEADTGPSLVQRNWLVEPPVLDPAWLAASEQYTLQAFVPREGGHFRLQAMWVVYASDAIPTDTGLRLTADDFQHNSEYLETWMDAHPG